MDRRIDRRKFLQYSLAATVFWVVGSEGAGAQTLENRQVNQKVNLRTNRSGDEDLFRVRPGCNPYSTFPQSVASGDPRPDGIVLWTRINPGSVPQRENRSSVRVAYEISSRPDFEEPVLRGVAATGPRRDHTLKVQITSRALKPFRTYYYRFIYRGCASRVGRFKTLPAPDSRVRRVRFGYISCQDYTNGYYTALAYLAREDLDFIAHLGDYIYETTGDPTFQGGQVRPVRLPSGRDRAETLADYRFLYKKYRSDRNLQRVHENFAFITIWDDHEFANDCYREYHTDTTDESQNFAPERRQAANQAWAEYIPAGIPFDSSEGPLESLRIYRSLAFGDLMELVMTDERLYRDGPPCGLRLDQRYFTPGCAERENPARTMLGEQQRRWFLNRIKNSPRIWKVWGNETMLMQLKLSRNYVDRLLPGLPSADVFVNLDQWDGYPAERRRIVRELKRAGVRNVVVITGDLHTFLCGYVKEDFDDPGDEPVAVAFMAGSVTSANLAELATFGQGLPVPPIADLTPAVRASNPHIQYFNSQTHGYNVMDVSPQRITCTMKAVSTVKAPTATLSVLRTFTVPRGRIEIRE